VESTPVLVEFSGDLTIRGITGAYETLSLALGSGSEVLASVPEDSMVDLTFVQLVESARRSARDNGHGFALTAPASGVLLETLRRGGFLAGADNREFWLMGSGDD
jgi:hypothetical protein